MSKLEFVRGDGLGGHNGGRSSAHATLIDGGKAAAVASYHLPQVYPILMV
jgi:hypothetical protein